ncbi:MAG: hypothetical protein AAGM67_16135, partial [Bacteroidota bacterium]
HNIRLKGLEERDLTSKKLTKGYFIFSVPVTPGYREDIRTKKTTIIFHQQGGGEVETNGGAKVNFLNRQLMLDVGGLLGTNSEFSQVRPYGYYSAAISIQKTRLNKGGGRGSRKGIRISELSYLNGWDGFEGRLRIRSVELEYTAMLGISPYLNLILGAGIGLPLTEIGASPQSKMSLINPIYPVGKLMGGAELGRRTRFSLGIYYEPFWGIGPFDQASYYCEFFKRSEWQPLPCLSRWRLSLNIPLNNRNFLKKEKE